MNRRVEAVAFHGWLTLSAPALDLTKFDVDRLRITDAAVAVLEVVPGLHLTGQFALGKNGTLV